MSDKEKKRFQDMAARDKMRYESEMQGYVPIDGGFSGGGGKGSRGGKRRRKDPNAPKRSLSAFLWFCNDERPKVKAANPEFGIGEMGKVLGRLWAGIHPTLKNKYQAMSDRDKARYEREMAAWKKGGKGSGFIHTAYGGGPGGGGGGGKVRRKKDPNAPKRSLSGFLWFCHEERPKIKAANPDFGKSGIGEMGKVLGRLWAQIDPYLKNKYQAMADRDKARYERMDIKTSKLTTK